MHEALALAEIAETDHLSEVVHPRPLCSGEPALVTLWDESSSWGFDEKSLEHFMYRLPYGCGNNAGGTTPRN